MPTRKTRPGQDLQTFVRDPETLPEVTAEMIVEGIVTELAPVVPTLETLVPLEMLDNTDEIVQAINEIVTYLPQTAEEYSAQAERVRFYANKLIVQKRRLDMLLAALAAYTRNLKLWRYLGEHCQNETQFWQICAGDSMPMERVNRLIDLRTIVAPMLHTIGESDMLLEEIDKDKQTELVRIARQAMPVATTTVAEPQLKIPTEVLREQVQTILVASPEDLSALRRMAKSEDPKQAIIMKMQPGITASGKRIMTATITWDEDQLRAYATRATYFVHSVGGEAVHITQLPTILTEWQPVEGEEAAAAPGFDLDDDIGEEELNALLGLSA